MTLHRTTPLPRTAAGDPVAQAFWLLRAGFTALPGVELHYIPKSTNMGEMMLKGERGWVRLRSLKLG